MKSKVPMALIRLLLACRICLGAVAPHRGKNTKPAPALPLGRHFLLDGVPNFGEVTPLIYRGGQPTQEGGFKKLARMGINIVVDTGRSKRDAQQISTWECAMFPFPGTAHFPKMKYSHAF